MVINGHAILRLRARGANAARPINFSTPGSKS
jgi:hypothetical protein